jgi:hypothetical protein
MSEALGRRIERGKLDAWTRPLVSVASFLRNEANIVLKLYQVMSSTQVHWAETGCRWPRDVGIGEPGPTAL